LAQIGRSSIAKREERILPVLGSVIGLAIATLLFWSVMILLVMVSGADPGGAGQAFAVWLIFYWPASGAIFAGLGWFLGWLSAKVRSKRHRQAA
jgi:hypothetical protein